MRLHGVFSLLSIYMLQLKIFSTIIRSKYKKGTVNQKLFSIYLNRSYFEHYSCQQNNKNQFIFQKIKLINMECLVERVLIDMCYLISYHKQKVSKNKQ